MNTDCIKLAQQDDLSQQHWKPKLFVPIPNRILTSPLSHRQAFPDWTISVSTSFYPCCSLHQTAAVPFGQSARFQSQDCCGPPLRRFAAKFLLQCNKTVMEDLWVQYSAVRYLYYLFSLHKVVCIRPVLILATWLLVILNYKNSNR